MKVLSEKVKRRQISRSSSKLAAKSAWQLLDTQRIILRLAQNMPLNGEVLHVVAETRFDYSHSAKQNKTTAWFAHISVPFSAITVRIFTTQLKTVETAANSLTHETFPYVNQLVNKLTNTMYTTVLHHCMKPLYITYSNVVAYYGAFTPEYV